MDRGSAGADRAALANPRFRLDETLRLPISLQTLSDCFAYMAQDVSDMLESLRYHYGEPEEAAEEAVSIPQQNAGSRRPRSYPLCYPT